MGTDANAALLRGALAEAGVRLDHLRTVDGPCGTAVILLQPSGRRTALLAPAAWERSCSTIWASDSLAWCLGPAGENSIIIVGGANTAPWDFDEAAVEVGDPEAPNAPYPFVLRTAACHVPPRRAHRHVG